MRFHKTINTHYQCIYDEETNEEYEVLYDMLPVLNAMARKIKRLEVDNNKKKKEIGDLKRQANTLRLMND